MGIVLLYALALSVFAFSLRQVLTELTVSRYFGQARDYSRTAQRLARNYRLLAWSLFAFFLFAFLFESFLQVYFELIFQW